MTELLVDDRDHLKKSKNVQSFISKQQTTSYAQKAVFPCLLTGTVCQFV
jgi:hypothetical protein